jgi:hypothetical protein
VHPFIFQGERRGALCINAGSMQQEQQHQQQQQQLRMVQGAILV